MTSEKLIPRMERVRWVTYNFFFCCCFYLLFIYGEKWGVLWENWVILFFLFWSPYVTFRKIEYIKVIKD